MAICACMIVRDEEKLLGRCLDSFAGAYDELCIVDTGSQDRTQEIAARYGARLRSFTACNGPDGKIRDFALARNTSLDMAQGEWILWMDADDVLQEGGAQRLRDHTARGGFDGLHVSIRWDKTVWLHLRLFRNLPHNRFLGRIHEFPRVLGRIETDREITIVHLPDKTGKEGSIVRALRLCELEVRDDPANPRALFYYANALRQSGRFEEAILRYTQYLAVAQEPRLHCERFTAAYYLALCHFLLRRWPESIDAAWRALRIDPRYAEAHCLIGDCYGELSNFAFARQWYRSALCCGAPPPDAALFVELPKYREYPLLAIEVCERRLGLAPEPKTNDGGTV